MSAQRRAILLLNENSAKCYATDFMYSAQVMCVEYPQKGPHDIRFEVFYGGDYEDVNTQFLPHRRHITSPLQSPAG
jgi:hypothetical protein